MQANRSTPLAPSVGQLGNADMLLGAVESGMIVDEFDRLTYRVFLEPWDKQ